MNDIKGFNRMLDHLDTLENAAVALAAIRRIDPVAARAVIASFNDSRDPRPFADNAIFQREQAREMETMRLLAEIREKVGGEEEVVRSLQEYQRFRNSVSDTRTEQEIPHD